MNKRFFLIISSFLLFVGCDAMHHKQYVIQNFTIEDKITVLHVLTNAAHTSALVKMAVESNNLEILPRFGQAPREGMSVNVWVESHLRNMDLVIDLFCFPNFTPLPSYQSMEKILSEKLHETFRERLIIDPKKKGAGTPKNVL